MIRIWNAFDCQKSMLAHDKWVIVSLQFFFQINMENVHNFIALNDDEPFNVIRIQKK